MTPNSRASASKRLRSSAASIVVGRGTQDRNPRRLQTAGQLERRLATELYDHTERPLHVDDLQHVLEAERFEVQRVRDIVVGGDRLRIGVHHDGLVAEFPKRERGPDAAVVEFHPLSNSIGSAAQDDDGSVALALGFVLLIVAGVEVGSLRGKFPGAGIHGLVGRADAELVAQFPDLLFRHAPEIRQLAIGEAQAFHPANQAGFTVDLRPTGRSPPALGLNQFEHLINEPRIVAGAFRDLLHRHSGEQRALDLEDPLGRRGADGGLDPLQ